jgi:hypothetical protein
MLTLNTEILKGIKFKSELDFDNEIYNYFLEFEQVFDNPDYLTRNKYIEKFTYMYNLCFSISILRNSNKIYDVCLFYKFIYARMENFLKCYISGLRHKITDFESFINVYENTLTKAESINGVLEYFNKEIHGISTLTENNKTFKELAIETWNSQINLITGVQDIITNYIIDLYINKNSDLDEKLNKYIRLLISYENDYIEKRYGFITKKVTKILKTYLLNEINKATENKVILDKLKIIQKYYNSTFEFCDSYFVPEFDEIGEESCLFIINNFLIEKSLDIISSIEKFLTEGDWKTFKQVFNILTKIDETGKLKNEIKNWGIENMVNTCCKQTLEKEKSKFKENKYSNVCKYLTYYKKIESLLIEFDDLFVIQLEGIMRNDLNTCYSKTLTGYTPTAKDKSLFSIDFADFIYKFLNNYEKSKAKFDLFNENNLRIIKIFIGLIENNDEFQLILQKYFAKRLFSSNVCDRDIYFMREIAKVDTLDVISSRVHIMIKDYESFNNINTNFKNVCDYYHINTDYKVITDVIWGLKETKFMDEQAGYKINVFPDDLKKLTKDFSDFYQILYENRKLKWNFSFSEFEIDFIIGEKIYTIQTIFPMAQILLYFNNNDKMMKVDVIREKISLKNIGLLKQFKIIKEVSDHYIINEEFVADPNEKIILTGVNNTIKRLTSKPNVKTDSLEIDDMLKAYLVRTMKTLGSSSIKRDILIKNCIENVKYRINVDRSRVNKILKKLIDENYMRIVDNGDVQYVP